MTELKNCISHLTIDIESEMKSELEFVFITFYLLIYINSSELNDYKNKHDCGNKGSLSMIFVLRNR